MLLVAAVNQQTARKCVSDNVKAENSKIQKLRNERV